MGILRITVDDSVDVPAIAARLHVTVRGAALVAGNAATKRAAEVRELVAALGQAGLSDDAFEVQGVRLSTSSSAVGRSQRVEIMLVVRVAPEQLPAVLGVLADRPNLRLGELEWVFDSFEASIHLAAAAMRKARRKADALAEAGGLTVAGVHSASDSWSMPEPRVMMAEAMAASPRMMKSAAPELDLGVEFVSTQKLQVHLSVDFTFG